MNYQSGGYQSYPMMPSYGGAVSTGCGCSSCAGGGMVMQGGGMVIQGGCPDCVGGSVPMTNGQIINGAVMEGTPVPASTEGAVEIQSDSAPADNPPSPDDA